MSESRDNPPAGYILRETGDATTHDDLWWDGHSNRWRQVNPKSPLAPVQPYERIARKETP